MDADILFPRVAQVSHERNLRLLVIGGHAVNAYGYSRTTLDSDFLVPEDDLPQWREVVEGWGFVWAMETNAFTKFKYQKLTPDAYTLDLMKVNVSTFEKLWAEKQERPFGSTHLMVANPLHLIAMKLHAMRHADRFKKGKDLPDILHLIRRCQLDPNDPAFQAVLHHYANEQTHKLLCSYIKLD